MYPFVNHLIKTPQPLAPVPARMSLEYRRPRPGRSDEAHARELAILASLRAMIPLRRVGRA